MDTDKRFAVIIASYRRKNGTTPGHIENMIKCLKNQTYENFKVFFIGDKYDDNTEFEAISQRLNENFSAVCLNNNCCIRDHQWAFPHNKWASGGIFARFKGIEMAIEEGFKYYLHLDDDDVWFPNHVELINECLNENPNAEMVFSLANYTNLKLPLDHQKYTQKFCNIKPKKARVVHSTWCINLQLKKESLISLFQKRIKRLQKTMSGAVNETRLMPFDAAILDAINHENWDTWFVNVLTVSKQTDMNIPE